MGEWSENLQQTVFKGLETNPVLMHLMVFGAEGKENPVPPEEVGGLLFQMLGGIQSGLFLLGKKLDEAGIPWPADEDSDTNGDSDEVNH